eukprot:Skav225387  [mRNA]  locus=scaffold2656:136122:139010:+ [translate_table: standard]
MHKDGARLALALVLVGLFHGAAFALGQFWSSPKVRGAQLRAVSVDSPTATSTETASEALAAVVAIHGEAPGRW